MSDEIDYPCSNLTPKRETGVLSFLNKYPNYDGRGTVIVVMDSGTDCSVDGLQKTSTGLPKIIERYDCTGDGDVDTSAKVTANSDGVITGLDGTSFKIPSTWENPSGQYHVGIKPLYELYVTKLRERIEERRKEENWDKPQALASARAVSISPLNNGNANSNNNLVDKYEKEEAEAQLEALDLLEKKYKDWGPLVHCILFKDKNDKWRIALALDTELEKVELLGEYSLDQSYIHMTNEDKLTISVNVWEDGNRLEIVSMCSSHGTHVAAIAAGYFPDNPALNGVAPGAQVISLTIGNGRLGSMESASAISRAAAFLQRNSHRLTVVNMSYGEHAHWSSSGRVGELMRDTVDKYGLNWVVSAGNHGPALSTVGTPPWICANNLIGVGAYISPEMMVAEYAIREKLNAMPYTWSSRGPTLDGDVGVSVAAPGGAITSVPSFTEKSNQLMNGTSMAAPHVAGVVALLASAAKDLNLRYSPYSMKRALEAGASVIEGADALSVGAGLVQVEPSLLKLEDYSKSPERDVRFNISVAGNQGGKGIYIRDLAQVQNEYSVTVEPVFFNAKEMDVAQKIEFSLSLVLVSNASWILAPSYLEMCNAQRGFSVKVDLNGLTGLQHGKVEAFDSRDPRRGPVFTLYVTAALPNAPPNRVVDLPAVHYSAGFLKRHFLSVPRGASQAVLSLKNEGQSPCRMVVHTCTLVQGQSCKTEEYYKVLALAANEEISLNFKVLEEKVLELVIGRWWSEPRTTVPVSAKVVYKSLTVDLSEIQVSATDSFVRVNVGSQFQAEDISPTVTLKNQVCLLRASNIKLLSLTSDRDTFPDGKLVYELVSTYSFSISRPTTVQVNCSLLSDTLYESDYESQLWMIFDQYKRMVGAGDAYPSKWPVKLEKGEYTMKLQIRHEKRDLLEKFVNGFPNFQGEALCPTLPVLLIAKLQANIPLGVHQSAHDLQVGRKGTGWTLCVKKGSVVPLYIATNIVDKTLKQLPCSLPTHYFSGSLVLQKDEKRSTPLRLFMPESAGKLKPADKSKDDLLDQIRDVKISWMGKTEKEESLKLYNELVSFSPNYLSIYTTRISALETLKKDTQDPDALMDIQLEIKELISKVCSLVDKNELLLYFASKNPNPDPKLKVQMEKNRSAFVDCLVKKGLLFPDELKEAWTIATDFFDPADSRILELSVKEAIERGHYGRAVRYLLKSEDALDKDKDKDKKLLELFDKLNWGGAVWLWKENIRFKNAIKDYRLF